MKIKFFVIILSIVLCSCGVVETNMKDEDVSVEKEQGTLNYDDMKAMWISQYDMAEIYTNGGKQRDKTDFTACVERIMDNVASVGINTIIVQVRPFADSMYPSAYYPVSRFVTGDYGENINYDPLEIIAEKAHEKDLSIHAWINPLRAMTENEIKKIPTSFKVREWYDRADGKYVVNVSGRLYLNPAYDEVRRLICDGAAEIVRLYNVDGIHMDDYFYPTTDERFDSLAYSDYKKRGGMNERAQFRRDNINKLVSEIYSAVKTENKDVLFGISPSGVMSNNYNKLYADVAHWCGNEGYIDYICPQVYFGFEHSTCDFTKVCREFENMMKRDDIRLIIGMTLGKAVSEYDEYAGKGKDEWRYSKDILKRELLYTMTIPKCSGVSYFSYQYFFDTEAHKTREERENFIPLLKEATWK